MIGDVLQFRDLQELCRPGKRPRLATVERWANQRKIRVQYDGQGGIWTTTAALNEALGVVKPESQQLSYAAEDLI